MFLRRYAEASFWMARYLERAENSARTLDIIETFGRDVTGRQNWASIVQINADDARFGALFGALERASEAAVKRFYVLDRDNPTSIAFAIRAARENARALRPVIATEMWVHVNMIFGRVQELTVADLAPARFAGTVERIRSDCQAMEGVVDGTLYRDQGWHFYQLGKYLERADQTTRVLDIKSYGLAPPGAESGAVVESTQWQTLLRSIAGYQGFRRAHRGPVTVAAVAAYVLFDRQFPRSVAHCLAGLGARLDELRRTFRLRGGARTLEALDLLTAYLAERPVARLLEEGLHGTLDHVQRLLAGAAEALAADFFPIPAMSASAPAALAETALDAVARV